MDDTSLAPCKVCKSCGESKPLTSEFFRPGKNYKDGFRNQCRECGRAQTRRWRKSNPDRVAVHNANSYRNNKPERNAKMKAHREANPERYREWDRARYLREREKLREQGRTHYQANKEKYAEYRDKRRAIERGGEGSYTRADVWGIYEEQEGCCYYCDGLLFGTFHVDHKQPVSRGGSNWPENLAVTCPTCNLRKQDKTEAEFKMILMG